jgi:hypothetical protein
MKAHLSTAIYLGLSIALSVDVGCSAERIGPEEILRNMPVNSDSRCTGIALVAEALLEGEMVSGLECDQPEELARQIFENARSNGSIRFQSNMCLEQGLAAIQSRVALERVSTEVANLYKRRHLELMASEEGKSRIVKAQLAMVTTLSELDAILEADRDKIHAFMVIGIRQFPDASEKPTYHVVLIAKKANGKKMIYDPNDPGTAIDCQMKETPDGLFVKWTCKYRNTGQVTTQEYQIVDRERFFQIAFTR